MFVTYLTIFHSSFFLFALYFTTNCLIILLKIVAWHKETFRFIHYTKDNASNNAKRDDINDAHIYKHAPTPRRLCARAVTPRSVYFSYLHLSLLSIPFFLFSFRYFFCLAWTSLSRPYIYPLPWALAAESALIPRA